MLHANRSLYPPPPRRYFGRLVQRSPEGKGVDTCVRQMASVIVSIISAEGYTERERARARKRGREGGREAGRQGGREAGRQRSAGPPRPPTRMHATCVHARMHATSVHTRARTWQHIAARCLQKRGNKTCLGTSPPWILMAPPCLQCRNVPRPWGSRRPHFRSLPSPS